MAEIIKFGSVYFDGQPQDVGAFYINEALSLGDTVPGQEISWVKLQSGLLIADRCICMNISWEQLHKDGFVLGTPIVINKETYLCRCIRIWTKGGAIDEWETALNEVGEDNEVWHWYENYFWCKDISEHNSLDQPVRGYYSACDGYNINGSEQFLYVGFRPVLEYLGPEPCPPDGLLGKNIKVYGSDGVTIDGSLVDFSDYDIVLKTGSPARANHSGTSTKGRNITISREHIIWLKEAEIEN